MLSGRSLAHRAGLIPKSMRFTFDHVAQFAGWSADQNPLHTDPVFARQTHFGRPIVHGVLTVLETLAAGGDGGAAVGDVAAFDIEFRSAAVIGAERNRMIVLDAGRGWEGR